MQASQWQPIWKNMIQWNEKLINIGGLNMTRNFVINKCGVQWHKLLIFAISQEAFRCPCGKNLIACLVTICIREIPAQNCFQNIVRWVCLSVSQINDSDRVMSLDYKGGYFNVSNPNAFHFLHSKAFFAQNSVVWEFPRPRFYKWAIGGL